MPKDRRARSISEERRCCASPFPYRLSNYHKNLSSSSSSSSWNPIVLTPSAEDVKEWEERRCPICMDHPHNAVLLLCTSNENGCRVYMCDTSHRHSNCLDLFRKNTSGQTSSLDGNSELVGKLQCPLCRGTVKGWTVVEAARAYMNNKTRSCSLESCAYTGTYVDLRKHARIDHPFLRPAQADPERQRDWRRMEQQRDVGDLLSSIRSSLGVEEADVDPEEIDVDDDLRGILVPATSFAHATLYIFIQILGTGGTNVLRYFSRMPPREATGSSGRGRRARLWGESYNDDTSSFSEHSSTEAVPDELVLAPELRRPRSRRRRMRLPDDEDEL